MLVATKRESRRDAKHKRVMFAEIAEMRDLTIHTVARNTLESTREMYGL